MPRRFLEAHPPIPPALLDAANERLAFDMLGVVRTFEEIGMKGTGASDSLRQELLDMLIGIFAEEAVWRSVAAVAEALKRQGRLAPAEVRALAPRELPAAVAGSLGPRPARAI